MHCFKNYNRIKLVCFLKIIVHKINYEIVKSGLVMLTEIEKTDMTVS
jgi:hypothetical protein